MRRLMLLTLLLIMAVFIMPTYADPLPKNVVVVNAPDNAVHVQGDVQVTNTVDAQVTNTVDVNVMNTAGNPVPVVMDGASTNGAVIKGINRADYTETDLSVGTKFELVSLTEPGTFVGARVYVDADSGGDPNSVRVELVIDGNTIVNDTFSEIGEAGAVTMTPFGIFRTNYGVHVGFQQPVSFDSGLTLSATIESVATIYAIQGSVIYGE